MATYNLYDERQKRLDIIEESAELEAKKAEYEACLQEINEKLARYDVAQLESDIKEIERLIAIVEGTNVTNEEPGEPLVEAVEE